MSYQVQVHSQNSWNSNGRPIVECDCGHKHRTLSGARRCWDRLTAPTSPRGQQPATYAAKWWHAHVYDLSTLRRAGDNEYEPGEDEMAAWLESQRQAG